MSDPRVKRRLAAIVALDIAGYSRLMGQDEEGTYRRLTAVMRDVVTPHVRDGDGHIVKTTGDGALVEFASIVAAVNSAVAIQRAMRRREARRALQHRIELRIGVNLGEVISEADDIYGEGVNIAARLEALAEPGGICITQMVAEQIAGRVAVATVDLGDQWLKNIARPVRVLRLALDEDRLRGRGAESLWTPARMPIVPGFNGRPAIAVLPFGNVGGDPELRYFADGLVEDITTALAGWRTFPVIARDSAFTYKERPADIRKVGRDLGVRYIVEGSVRGRGGVLRVTAQLVDVETTHHLCAERYDREMTDKFGMHDEIVTSIVGALEPELLRAERDRIATQAPPSPGAYDLLQRGLWHHYRRTRQDSAMAQAFFRNALAVDPDYVQAIAALSVCLVQSRLSGWEDDGDAALAEALELAQRAVFLDSRDPLAHFALGAASLHNGQIEFAIRENEAAIRLNPSHAAAHANLAFANNYLNRPERAYASVSLALRLSPNDPRQFIWMPALAASHYLAGQYEQALDAARRGLAMKPDYLVAARYLVAALGQLGRVEEAAAVIPLLRQRHPDLAAAGSLLARYFNRAALDHIVDGLRKAGFR